MGNEKNRELAQKYLKILLIAYAVFLMLFSLDVFEMQGSFTQKIGGFLIHSLPSIAIIALTAALWKRPRLAGLAMVLIAVAMTIIFRSFDNFITFILISAIPVVIGSLLIVLDKDREK